MVNGPRPSLMQNAQTLSQGLRESSQLLAELDAHLARATQPQPESRPATIREFWDAVEPLLRTASETSLPPPAAIPLVAEGATPRRVDRTRRPKRLRAATRFASWAACRVLTLCGPRSSRPTGAMPSRSAPSARTDGRARAGQLVPLPGWLDHGVLHGIAALPDGGLLLFGERGTVLALSSTEKRNRGAFPTTT